MQTEKIGDKIVISGTGEMLEKMSDQAAIIVPKLYNGYQAANEVLPLVEELRQMTGNLHLNPKNQSYRTEHTSHVKKISEKLMLIEEASIWLDAVKREEILEALVKAAAINPLCLNNGFQDSLCPLAKQAMTDGNSESKYNQCKLIGLLGLFNYEQNHVQTSKQFNILKRIKLSLIAKIRRLAFTHDTETAGFVKEFDRSRSLASF